MPDLTSDQTHDRSRASDPGVVRVPTQRHARRGALLLALAVFQFWLWGTRLVNLVRGSDGFSAAFIAVHSVLYAAAIAAGVIFAVLGVRMWREARAARVQASEGPDRAADNSAAGSAT